ncbi:hypothetical protein L1987_06971 [Smallanthus sonchifolius]|uniref:Uncharacterized protein n=1 Tax=Smallanthus sonchifolius TaxID=185202 RepID=A0ACB9JZJ1_9ASTR|nr:hypothetical protein L1987_06971 [Smallanthus sonchifolius]
MEGSRGSSLFQLYREPTSLACVFIAEKERRERLLFLFSRFRLRCRSYTQSITDEPRSEFTAGIMLAVTPSYFTLIYLCSSFGQRNYARKVIRSVNRGYCGGGRILIRRRRDGNIAKCQVFSTEAAPETLLNGDAPGPPLVLSERIYSRFV